MNREILLEMYEKLWNADKDKFTWNAILKDTLEKLETFNTKKNEKRMAHMDVMNHEAFNKMMGYPLDEVKRLADLLKEINRNRIVELNQRDLKENGIEND